MKASKCQKRRAAVTRRTFLKTTAAAWAGIQILPRSVVGGGAEPPPSERVNLGFIGVGAQGFRVMLSFLQQADVQGVAVCDVNQGSAGYPQWGKNEFCNSVRRLLGATSGWDWLSPNDAIQLPGTAGSFAGMSGREPCQKIIEAYYGTQKRSGNYRGCAVFADFRELLEKQKDLDGVVVCTPDHWHALVSITAMRKGKHVFCQKPMTRTVYEARRMGEVARESRVSTQVAVGNQASEATRLLCEWIWSGAIGGVRQVENWSSRPFWPQGLERPAGAEPVPTGLDWDLWLGPSPARPFHHAYLPFVWRGWHDFGGGAIGDMGGYSFDTIFRALKLESPRTVEASSTRRFAETYPLASIMQFDFGEREGMPPVRVTWYDGGLKPARPAGWEKPLPDEGLLFLGDRGTILCGFNGANPRLIPEEKMKEFKPPPKTLPRSPGNEREWLDACKGGKTRPGANFEFSAKVTEALLLGNVALRAGEKLTWDPAELKAVNLAAAERLIRPDLREGWTL